MKLLSGTTRGTYLLEKISVERLTSSNKNEHNCFKKTWVNDANMF